MEFDSIVYTVLGTCVITCATCIAYMMTQFRFLWLNWLVCLALSKPLGYMIIRWNHEIIACMIIYIIAACTWKVWNPPPCEDILPIPNPKPLAIAIEHPDGYICLGV